MPRPDVHPTVEDLYGSLGSGITGGDEGTGWQLLRYVAAIAGPLTEVDDLVRDSVAGPGWSKALDVDRADPQSLAYLAQFVGARLIAGLSDTEQRARIRDAEGWRRGTPAAIVQAARSLLTGGQAVLIEERYGDDAYALRVRTYTVQTPDPDAVEAQIRRQKPAGIVLTYETIDGGTYADLTGHSTTYTDLESDFTDYADETAWTP